MSYLLHKWNLRKLQRKRRAIKQTFEDTKRLLKKGSLDPYADAELQADEFYESEAIDEWIEAFRSSYLIDQAIELDVETPPVSDDSEFWKYTDDHENWYLNRKGRDLVQDLINKKKDRDSEGWARFSRIFVPIITTIAGLLGIITGLVAVIQHKK
jgi:hypothetical protein